MNPADIYVRSMTVLYRLKKNPKLSSILRQFGRAGGIYGCD